MSLFFAGVFCWTFLFQGDLESRAVWGMILAAILVVAFGLFKLIPFLNMNWVLYSLIVFGFGLTALFGFESKSFSLVVGGFAIVLVDLLYRYLKFDQVENDESDSDPILGSGAHLSVLFFSIPGWLLGTLLLAAGVATMYVWPI